MRSPARMPFVAVFQNEVLLNSKRVAPFVLMMLFGANAVLWWGWGPAVRLGWATNSDYYIVRNLQGFSFLLGLPIFNALIMGDPVIRDFRLGIDPLIFSKPLHRAEYLLGKFCGSFFVLICSQSAFALTLLVLQAFRTSQMVVQPVRVFPYFKHFFFFVVISHLILAAIYFTLGTLTRNPKFVYGLAACFYPLYIAYQVLLLKDLPPRWQTLLDPLLLNSGPDGGGFGHSADFLNRLVVSYTPDMITNRAIMILVTAVCLAILCFRFTIADRSEVAENLSTLNLSTAASRVYFDSESLLASRGGQRIENPDFLEQETRRVILLPEVFRTNKGIRTNVSKLTAAVRVEFRLLCAERSLVVLMPLAVFLSILDLAFYRVVPEVSYSATYASGTARTVLLFLLGLTVFYTGEAIHRDREVRIEPVLWSLPAGNNVLLLSKFLATILLTLSLVVLVALTAIMIQFLKGHTPVEVSPYLTVYSVILFPSIVFLAGISLALNVLLRDKYIAYAVSIGASAGLFYLYSQGYNHWLYNPLLYRLWNHSDLTNGGSERAAILTHRISCLALAITFLSFAHLCYRRKSTRGWLTEGRLSSSGWSISMIILSVAVAVIAALLRRD